LSDKTYDPAVDNLLKVLTDNVNGHALVLMDFPPFAARCVDKQAQKLDRQKSHARKYITGTISIQRIVTAFDHFRIVFTFKSNCKNHHVQIEQSSKEKLRLDGPDAFPKLRRSDPS